MNEIFYLHHVIEVYEKIINTLNSLLIYSVGYSQTLKFVNFSGGSEFSSLSYITNQKIIIKVSQDGKVIEWGNEMEPGRFYTEPGKLQPYMGRVEYYEKQFDSMLNGKVKNIGITSITYYGSTEKPALVGKVKSIGNVLFNYYLDQENEAVRGKLKTAGIKNFTYYYSYENEAYRGKIKSIGNNQVTYYSTFDDKSIRGKLKSIGSAIFYLVHFTRPPGLPGRFKIWPSISNDRRGYLYHLVAQFDHASFFGFFICCPWKDLKDF